MKRPDFRRLFGCACLASSPALLSWLAGGGVGGWSAIGAALVAAGLATARLTRGPTMSAPLLMLILSTLGMAVGVMIDCRTEGPAVIASLCGTGPESFVALAARHFQFLRATNLTMVMGGLATMIVVEYRARRIATHRCGRAVCADAGFNIACNLTMLAGMLLSAWLGPPIAARLGLGWGVDGMMAAMVAGMVWGMAGTVIVARAGFATGDRPATRRAVALDG